MSRDTMTREAEVRRAFWEGFPAGQSMPGTTEDTTMITEQMIETAIRESIQADRIVTIDGDAATHDALTLRADDSADAGDVTEYWGTNDDGQAWRIHVAR